MANKLIIRIGDEDIYKEWELDDLDPIAQDMIDSCVVGPIERVSQWTYIDQGEYKGNNYISAYVGTVTNPVRDITDEELIDINTTIKRLRHG